MTTRRKQGKGVHDEDENGDEEKIGTLVEYQEAFGVYNRKYQRAISGFGDIHAECKMNDMILLDELTYLFVEKANVIDGGILRPDLEAGMPQGPINLVWLDPPSPSLPKLDGADACYHGSSEEKINGDYQDASTWIVAVKIFSSPAKGSSKHPSTAPGMSRTLKIAAI